MRRSPAALLLCVLLPAARAAEPPVPLPRAFSHNDYEQARPLLDALDRGFCSVEADVHLIDGELRIGHKREETRPGDTLQSLYLDPLLERVRRNGGLVHPGGPGFILLVDVKSDARQTYAALREALKGYAEMLTRFSGEAARAGAVTVVVSGHRDKETVSREPERLAALDGGLGDLDPGEESLYPMVSADWRSLFTWRGGRMDPRQRARLDGLVRKAHERGRKVRFWAIPDDEEGWRMMLESGVDHINTDKVEELKDFLLDR